ncbi:MAG: DNA polymerase III subunit beta [Clostridia bacterium]|nr:DNA polymerase III subunit beta [Clostridia bacterium]
MKFTSNQQSLAKALTIVSKAVTNRTTLPIMKGILLEVEGNTLKLSATDYYLSIETKLNVDNTEKGSVVVDARLFTDIIRKLPIFSEITIEAKGDNVNIISNNSNYNVIGMPSEEFPIFNIDNESAEKVSFEKDIISKMIKRTSFSASVDESKGIITGVLIELLNDSLNMVALDNPRMAVTRENLSYENEQSIIIPAKILNEVNKIITETMDDDYEVVLYISNKKAVFVLGETKVAVNLLDGQFINYKAILPTNNNVSIIINRKELLENVERASIFSKDGNNKLIKMTITDDCLKINSNSEEGRSEEKMFIHKEGEDIEIGLNSKYIIDVLKVLEEDEILIEMTSDEYHNKPCMIKPIEGNQYEYLILPVRLNS